MSRNMKVLTVILALGALASARYLFALVGSPETGTVRTKADQTALLLRGAMADDDRDGLTLREEQYWRTDPENADTDGDGFLDGEEVASGHHPLIKGPNDWLDRGKNITNRTIELALGGAIEGDLVPGNGNYEEAVRDLAEAMAEQYRRNAAVATDQLMLIEPTLENKEQYLKSMSEIFVRTFVPMQQEMDNFLDSLAGVPLEDPLVLTKDKKRYDRFVATARQLSGSMGERAEKLAAIPVPRTFLPEHRSGVLLLRHLQANLKLATTLKEDVLQGTAAIRVLTQLQVEATPRFIYNFSRALQTKLNR